MLFVRPETTGQKKNRQAQIAEDRPRSENITPFALFKLAEQILAKDEATKYELELCKLCLSSTISFVSPKINALFETLLPITQYNEAEATSASRRINIACSDDISDTIEQIVNGMLPFENDLNTNR